MRRLADPGLTDDIDDVTVSGPGSSSSRVSAAS